MSGYQKILVRFGILAVLVVGARMLTPPPTLAFDCCLDCAHQWLRGTLRARGDGLLQRLRSPVWVTIRP